MKPGVLSCQRSAKSLQETAWIRHGLLGFVSIHPPPQARQRARVQAAEAWLWEPTSGGQGRAPLLLLWSVSKIWDQAKRHPFLVQERRFLDSRCEAGTRLFQPSSFCFGWRVLLLWRHLKRQFKKESETIFILDKTELKMLR